MKESEQKAHWTHRLFVEHAELYLPFLQQASERAAGEVEMLARLFDEYGVPPEGRVLDVACGIGRHSLPLAQRGYRVTGIDLSPLFIYEARQQAELIGVPLNFMLGDVMRVAELLIREAPFDAFINMFTSHGYYGRDSDLALFRQLRGIASPSAVLVVMTINRDWIVRNFQPEGVDSAGDIRILQRRSLDLETSTNYNDWEFYEGTGESLRLRLKLRMDHRLYSLHELKALLEEAGWRYLRGLGRQPGDDPGLGPVTIDARDMWLVARASACQRLKEG